MVYACHSVGCHDICHSRIEERGERRHIRIGPDAAVDKARLLESFGWQVHITDSAGRKFGVSDFINRETAVPEITLQRRQ